MATPRRRRRLKLMLDDGQAMRAACALRMDGERILVDSGVSLAPGQALNLYPLPDDPTVALLDMDAAVVEIYEDVLVPADAEFRFLSVLKLDMDARQRELLVDLVQQGDVTPSRFRRKPWSPTHDDGVLVAALAGS